MKGIEKRKADHIEVSLEETVSPAHDYWDDVKLIHNSLPEVDMDDIDTSVRLFGKRLEFPLMVTAITGGYSKAEKINRHLAIACEKMGVGLGVGSQRAALEKGDPKSYTVIKEYDIPLKIGNIGAPQLISQKGKRAFTREDVEAALEMVGADLVAIHLNYLQEIAQPEGDTNAKGCVEAIRSLSRDLPLIVKETGAGISREVAIRLKGTGIRGMDVSGTGGTSFSLVESRRAQRMGDARCTRLGDTFGDWGIPAPVSVIWADVGIPLIASGGINNGLHVAKSIALGAQCAGTARSVLKEALESPEAVASKLQLMLDEFRAAMFLTSCSKVGELGRKGYVLIGATREWFSYHPGEV
jgi:isopentenyl-diphosphate delta-isomerase